MKRLVIMVGPSGSGKSTEARRICDEAGVDYSAIFSTDSYFNNPETGAYEFDWKKLGEYHCRNFEAAKSAMIAGQPLVIIDNTNLVVQDRGPYIEVGQANGYEIQLLVMDRSPGKLELYAGRNKHGVSLEKVRKQAARMDVEFSTILNGETK